MEVLQWQEWEKKGQARMGVLPEDWENLTLPKLFRASGEGLSETIIEQRCEPGREAYDGNDKDLGDDALAHSEPKRVRLTPQPSSSALPPSPLGDAHLFLP